MKIWAKSLVPYSVTNLHPEMSEGYTRGIWEEAHANLLGERPTPKLILHFGGFTLWLPEETWTWELGAIQSIRFTHSSMCLPTCWGESRQPDEEAIPPRSIIKGKCLSARSMCYKLQCTRFLQKETERKKKWAVQRRPEAAALGWEGAGGRKMHLAENCAPLRHTTAFRYNWEPLRLSPIRGATIYGLWDGVSAMCSDHRF
ncbi:hypothetical protein Q8A73_014156 [Channa argus]|nr:hypothetical protein Q8A73_014156 [Channa argus]